MIESMIPVYAIERSPYCQHCGGDEYHSFDCPNDY